MWLQRPICAAEAAQIERQICKHLSAPLATFSKLTNVNIVKYRFIVLKFWLKSHQMMNEAA